MHSSLLIKELQAAGKELKDDNVTIVRCSEKNQLLCHSEPHWSQTKIWCNTWWWKKVQKYHSQSKCKVLNTIIGEFKPGYVYGTVEIHKANDTLRHIHSKIPTPIDKTAKQIITLMKPFLPATYQIISTDDFLQLLQTTQTAGLLASLDVEQIFTNVPVDSIITCVCAYNHPNLQPHRSTERL